MGAWGGLAIFNYDKFLTEIIPALKSGEDHPLVKSEIEKINSQDRNLSRSPKFQNLETIINTFNDELNITSIGNEFVFSEGKIIEKIENFDFQNSNYWDYWDLVRLVELIITRNCIEYVTNFGLKNNCLNLFSEIKDNVGMELINVLSTKGNYWRHSGGGWSEGIHGWLDKEETKLFSLVVDEIKPQKDYLDDERLPLRLNSLKLMIKEAARLDKGVIWGADLKILYSINWRNKNIGSIVKITNDVTNCLNSIKEVNGEVAIFK